MDLIKVEDLDFMNLFQDFLNMNLHEPLPTCKTVWVLRIPRQHTNTTHGHQSPELERLIQHCLNRARRVQTSELHHQMSHHQMSHHQMSHHQMSHHQLSHYQPSHHHLSHKVTSDTAHVLHNPVNVLTAATGAHTTFHGIQLRQQLGHRHCLTCNHQLATSYCRMTWCTLSGVGHPGSPQPLPITTTGHGLHGQPHTDLSDVSDSTTTHNWTTSDTTTTQATTRA